MGMGRYFTHKNMVLGGGGIKTWLLGGENFLLIKMKQGNEKGQEEIGMIQIMLNEWK